MNIVGKLLVTSAVAFAFALPAVAEEAPDLSDRTVVLMDKSGKTMRMKASDKAHAELMKRARPLPEGALIYMSGGKLYSVPNRKLPSGMMLMDAVRDNSF
jgi:hypothetical protein